MPGWIPCWHSPAVGDIDGDGLQEIVLGIRANPALYALNGEDGSTLWTFPVGDEILLINSDNDGDLEVLTRVNIGGGITLTYLLDGLTGGVIWVVNDTPSSIGVDPELNLASGDLDGDGVLEVVNLTTMGRYESIHIYDARDGTLLLKGVRYLDPIDYVVYGSPLLYDIDGDGNLEILVENWTLQGSGVA